MPLELAWPMYKVSSLIFTPKHFNRISGQSALSPVARITGATSIVWRAEMTLTELSHDDARDLDAFLASLRGGLNKVLLYDSARKMRGTGAVSTCNIDISSPAGSELVTVKNLVVNQALAFRGDDMIGIAGNIYKVTNGSPSDANGKSTISITPGLRMGVAADDVVDVSDPTGRFTLVEGFESTYLITTHAGGNKLMFNEDPYFV